MHPSVSDYVQKVVVLHPPRPYADVLEVGSYDVNGSVRHLFRHAHRYVGMDAREGPGVDLVGNVEEPPVEVAGHQWDVVVSTEMLEHTAHPWVAFANMCYLLAPEGRLILTTRAPGFGIHEYPGDYYRFTPAALEVLALEAGLQEVEVEEDPDVPGVFITGVSP